MYQLGSKISIEMNEDYVSCAEEWLQQIFSSPEDLKELKGKEEGEYLSLSLSLSLRYIQSTECSPPHTQVQKVYSTWTSS